MNIFKNYINKQTPTGIYKTDTIADIRMFLLGLIKSPYGETHIAYRPERLSSRRDYYIPNESKNKKNLFYLTQMLHHEYIMKQNRINALLNVVNNTTILFRILQTRTTNYSNNPQDDYDVFKIPKRTPGKFRTITSPHQKLAEIQHTLLDILNFAFPNIEHEAAHAYVKNRGCATNAQRHQYANHIVKCDIHDFFPSINPEFATRMLLSLHDFAILNMPREDYQELSKKDAAYEIEYTALSTYYEMCRTLFNAILNYGFYKNGLPQGSPLSPKLSNIVMFPIDHTLSHINDNHEITAGYLMYTRYADDLCFSSYEPINKDALLTSIANIFKYFDAPFELNQEKTEYLQPRRKCYMTGVKINREHNLTYGHERKAELKHELFQILLAAKEGRIDVEHNRSVLGKIANMQQIEPEYTKMLIRKYADKFNIPIKRIYKHLLQIQERTPTPKTDEDVTAIIRQYTTTLQQTPITNGNIEDYMVRYATGTTTTADTLLEPLDLTNNNNEHHN